MRLFVCLLTFIAVSSGVSFADSCTNRWFGSDGWCHPQCVEYVKCRVGLKGSFGNASNWWFNPPPGYKKRENGSKSTPSKNDIIVWTKLGNSNYGHVAIIDEINKKKGYIIVSDTNRANDVRKDCNYRQYKIKLTEKKDRYYIDGGASGWLEKK